MTSRPQDEPDAPTLTGTDQAEAAAQWNREDTPSTGSDATPGLPDRRWGPSPLTVVWGALLLACAALGAAYGFLGLSVDPVLTGALLVAGCGLFLILAAALGSRRPAAHQGTGGPDQP